MAGSIDVDVVVVGNGLVGGQLAVALARSGFTVAAVDGQDPAEALGDRFDGRNSAVALTSHRMLTRIGSWAGAAEEAAEILDIRVTERDRRRFLHYDHRTADAGGPFGWIVPNHALRRGIVQAQRGLAGLTVLAPDPLVSLHRTEGRVTARTRSGAVIHARLVVAADGRGSAVRDQAGIPVLSFGYGQAAAVTVVRHAAQHRNIAHEIFLPAGPFAILPLRDQHRSAIVWTDSAAQAEVLRTMNEAAFVRELRQRIGGFLGQVDLDDRRWIHPLGVQFARRYTDKRLVLVGDAAHGMHPIAGQGMNMGLRDVAALVHILEDARRVGQDIGADQVLARYPRWRRFDNLLMIGMTDGLNRLFSNANPMLAWGRATGLGLVDRLPRTKRFFMRQAMGLAGDLPHLMRA